jgi:hypothetical protein
MVLMDKSKYFIVIAKCGHVGRNRYIEKELTIRATSGKEAAKIARNYPRVKHHWKDAIVEVIEVDVEEFKRIRVKNYSDPYFSVKNIQEQRMYCINIDEHIRERQSEESYKQDRVKRINYMMKKRKIEERLSMMY